MASKGKKNIIRIICISVALFGVFLLIKNCTKSLWLPSIKENTSETYFELDSVTDAVSSPESYTKTDTTTNRESEQSSSSRIGDRIFDIILLGISTVIGIYVDRWLQKQQQKQQSANTMSEHMDTNNLIATGYGIFNGNQLVTNDFSLPESFKIDLKQTQLLFRIVSKTGNDIFPNNYKVKDFNVTCNDFGVVVGCPPFKFEHDSQQIIIYFNADVCSEQVKKTLFSFLLGTFYYGQEGRKTPSLSFNINFKYYNNNEYEATKSMLTFSEKIVLVPTSGVSDTGRFELKVISSN